MMSSIKWAVQLEENHNVNESRDERGLRALIKGEMEGGGMQEDGKWWWSERAGTREGGTHAGAIIRSGGMFRVCVCVETGVYECGNDARCFWDPLHFRVKDVIAWSAWICGLKWHMRVATHTHTQTQALVTCHSPHNSGWLKVRRPQLLLLSLKVNCQC